MVRTPSTPDKETVQTGNIIDVMLAVDEEAIVGIGSFAEAMALFAPAGGIVQIGDVAGDGFAIVDKSILLNIPFVLIDWKEIIDPDSGRPYATVRCVTSDGRKYRFSGGVNKDNTSGILAQLEQIRERTGRTMGIGVPHGLVESSYFIDEATKTPIPKDQLASWDRPKTKASTFYLSTAS